MTDASAAYLRQKSENAKKTENPDKRMAIIKIVVIILCLVLAFEVILYLFIVPCLAPVKIVFTGTRDVNGMSRMLDSERRRPWIRFDSAQAVSILSSVPSIKEVTLEKRFPDHVFVRIKERIPVAMTFVMVDNRTIPVQIDENGVLFPVTSSYLLGDGLIPLVTGLPVERIKNGMRLPAKYCELMAQVSKIQKLPQKYFAAISEIHVVPKDYGNYELILYPVHSKLRVLTDRTLNESTLRQMLVVLDVVNSVEPNVTEIDLRYGSVSYKTR